MRKSIGEAAVLAAKAVNYVGAGELAFSPEAICVVHKARLFLPLNFDVFFEKIYEFYGITVYIYIPPVLIACIFTCYRDSRVYHGCTAAVLLYGDEHTSAGGTSSH